MIDHFARRALAQSLHFVGMDAAEAEAFGEIVDDRQEPMSAVAERPVEIENDQLIGMPSGYHDYPPRFPRLPPSPIGKARIVSSSVRVSTPSLSLSSRVKIWSNFAWSSASVI